MYTGERQVSTLRKKYLEAVLKQDVGFFDTDARTGDIVFSVSTDTLLVQDAISEKVLNLNFPFLNASLIALILFNFGLIFLLYALTKIVFFVNFNKNKDLN